jgi:uncharacterized repeat protein (TIGR01451 family)
MFSNKQHSYVPYGFALLYLVLFLFPLSASAHNTTTPNLNFPSGTAATVDGIISAGEYDDANYVTFVQGIQTIEMWFKFDPGDDNIHLAFRIPDTTNNGANDRITLYMDNYNDGSDGQDWGFGIDRNTSQYEYRDLSPINLPAKWDSDSVDFITYFEVEFEIELKSANFRFSPGVDPVGPGLLIELWDNAVMYYYPITGGPRTDYNSYTDCYSPDLWLSKPTATPSITLTATPTPSITLTPSPTVTNTFTSTPTNTSTLTMTPTSTNTPTVTVTPTVTATNTNVPIGSSMTATPTISATYTGTYTSTTTPSVTSTATPTYTFSATPTASPTATWTPTSTITMTGIPTSTYTSTATPTITSTPFVDVVLVLQKSADHDQAVTGDVIRYHLSYENQGSSLARNIVITDQLPMGTRYNAGTGQTDIPGLIYWTGNIAPFGSGEVWFEVEVEDENGQLVIDNTANIICDNSNTVTSNTVSIQWNTLATPTPPAAIVGNNEVANYPNPAWGTETTFAFYSEKAVLANIRIYNTAGKLVHEIHQSVTGGQIHRVPWNIQNIPPGIYIYQLILDGKPIAINKMAVVKRK